MLSGEAGLLSAAVEWAALHEPTDLGDAASWWLAGEAIPLAGDGTPEVAAWAVAEFAAAVGLTTDSGRRLIGHALELAWRLPTLWEQVQEGRVPAWRARRVADATMSLNRVAAGFVDRQVAAVAGKISLPQLDRLVTEAKVRHEAAERPDPSDPCPTGPETRRVDVRTDQVTFDGTVPVIGELDLADALHLDQALAAGAEQLRIAGSADTLDARRAVALGEMSRAQLALTFCPADGTAVTSGRPVRPITLFLHLSEAALAGASPVGRCENTATPINAETIRAWCGHPDTKITVRPILDLAEHVRVDQYEIPDRLTRPDRSPRRRLRVPVVHPTSPRVRPRPPRALRPRRSDQRPGPRPDLLLQPRTAVPTSPPVEDPHPVALPITPIRHLPLDQPPRLRLPPQPRRHHRCHPTRRGDHVGLPARPVTTPPRTPSGIPWPGTGTSSHHPVGLVVRVGEPRAVEPPVRNVRGRLT